MRQYGGRCPTDAWKLVLVIFQNVVYITYSTEIYNIQHTFAVKRKFLHTKMHKNCKMSVSSVKILILISKYCGPGSSVGIATDYGMDGPGSNPSGDEIFRPSRPALWPTQPLLQ